MLIVEEVPFKLQKTRQKVDKNPPVGEITSVLFDITHGSRMGCISIETAMAY